MSRFGAIVVREIREAVPAVIFFLCVFHLIALTRAVLVNDFSASALRATTATISALIVAKSILVVDKLRVANIFSGRLVLHALWKALLFGAVAMAFRFVEEVVRLMVKHRGLADAAAQVRDRIPWPAFWVFQLWLFGALFLYCLARELIGVIGPANVRSMLWRPRAHARGAAARDARD
jgi:hypothetical protein